MEESEIATPSNNYPIVRVIDDVNVPCRLAPLDLRVPFEALAAEQYGTDAKWRVMFDPGMFIANNRRLLITGVTNLIPWTQHLEVLGEITVDHEMMHRVACATLKEVKIQEYYA